jgi:DNA segregation ATPase FtsK/SpoIIIE, S-DNA-T family
MSKSRDNPASLLHLSRKKVQGYFRLLGEDLRVVLGVEKDPAAPGENHRTSSGTAESGDFWRSDAQSVASELRRDRVPATSSEGSFPEGDSEGAEDLQPGETVREAEQRARLMQTEDELLEGWRNALFTLERQQAEARQAFAERLAETRRELADLAASAKANMDPESLHDNTSTETEPSPDSLTEEGLEKVPTPSPTLAETLEGSQEEQTLAAYQFPALDLLDLVEVDKTVPFIDPVELEHQQNLLQRVLDSFTVDAQVCDAIVGPRVTQFRVRPGIGVRVEAITALDRNIALGMEAESVRIQAPIPGEAFVGVETPNRYPVPICLRTLLASKTWGHDRGTLPLALGIDISGHIILADLTKAPHLLIAGATGSGKSVCMNNIILSLLYRFSPEELELALVDPKKVEFSLYRDVPHLIHPVVTESRMVVGLLHWMVLDMERRYTLLASRQVRNIASFNEKARLEGFAPLPYTVLIIDELADLMMTHGHEVETHLARLAQLSRAAGIHTILATQRPSVNVITGVIKANFPTRIAFRVSSQIDSRTILDSKGAESLLGRGDMLFNPPGASRLMRIQGPMVEDAEIERVVQHIAGNRKPLYRIEIPQETSSVSGPSGGLEEDSGGDSMLRQALEIILTHERATTSFLQRRLRIGYNRAASIIDELEAKGIIGPQVGTLPREILKGRDAL